MRTIYPRQDLYSVQALVFRDARQVRSCLSLLIPTSSTDLSFYWWHQFSVLESNWYFHNFALYFHFVLITLIFCYSVAFTMFTLHSRNTTRKEGENKSCRDVELANYWPLILLTSHIWFLDTEMRQKEQMGSLWCRLNIYQILF